MNEWVVEAAFKTMAFLLQETGTIGFCQLSNPFLRNKGGWTKFSQILLLYSEAINTVFYFLMTSQLFFPFPTFPPLDKRLSQAANPERAIGIKESCHQISHNTTRQIKELQMQHYWTKNMLQVAQTVTETTFNTHCDRPGPIFVQKYSTQWYHFHVYCGENQIQLQLSAKAALVGLLH